MQWTNPNSFPGWTAWPFSGAPQFICVGAWEFYASYKRIVAPLCIWMTAWPVDENFFFSCVREFLFYGRDAFVCCYWLHQIWAMIDQRPPNCHPRITFDVLSNSWSVGRVHAYRSTQQVLGQGRISIHCHGSRTNVANKLCNNLSHFHPTR